MFRRNARTGSCAQLMHQKRASGRKLEDLVNDAAMMGKEDDLGFLGQLPEDFQGGHSNEANRRAR